MTDKEINIAITECCGWKKVNYFNYGPTAYVWVNPPQDARSEPAPYCTDLHSMHEAEESLDSDEWQDYGDRLIAMINPRILHADYWKVLHATARQRAEAFLRTKGKWKE